MDFEFILPAHTQEAYEQYCNMETDWMAEDCYAESKEALLREIALLVILQSSRYDKLDAFIPYLAMNIFDRFISRHQLPIVLRKVRDDLVLAAHCCLTMAWKMRDISTFSYQEFVEKRNLSKDYAPRMVQMEVEIIKKQEWHTRAVIVTPICFVGFFAAKIPVGRGIKSSTLNEIIIQTQGDINFTRFRPSVIAASTILAAGRLLYGNQLYERNKRILLARKYVKKEELEACLTKTYEMCIEKKILLERNEGRELKVGAGETSTSSSSSHRPGKEPMQEEIQEEPMQDEIQEEPMHSEIQEEIIVPEMNFELKWMQWSSDDPKERTIDSPVFRAPTPAPKPYDGRWGEVRCCFNLWPPRSSCNIL